MQPQEDHSARLVLSAAAVIALLLGLLFWSSERVDERRAEMTAQTGAAHSQDAAAEGPGPLTQLLASIQARRDAQLKSGRNRQLQLASLGVVLIVGSQLWCAASAFGISVAWGLLVLFTPCIGAIAFSLFHWEEARGAVAGYAVGTTIALASNLL